jgi:hypothetical protein
MADVHQQPQRRADLFVRPPHHRRRRSTETPARCACHPAPATAVGATVPAKVPAADAHPAHQPVPGELEVAQRTPEDPGDVEPHRGPPRSHGEGQAPVDAGALAVVEAEDDRCTERPATDFVALPGQGEVGLHARHLGLGHPDPQWSARPAIRKVSVVLARRCPRTARARSRRMGTPRRGGGGRQRGTNAHRSSGRAEGEV